VRETREETGLDLARDGERLEPPCLRIDELMIWGLTYRMFESLVPLLGGEA
jgi:8-oxo-dGTP pyrophosphatase MutT (NUDIX family)